jgi:methyl-accepting chemotaxis protein
MSWLSKFTHNGGASAGNRSAQSEQLMAQMPERISAAVTAIDREFKLTYVNGAAKALFTKNIEMFKAEWPSFDPETVLGSVIELFQKEAAHYKSLLSDPVRLPVEQEITVGDLKIALIFSALTDRKGKYVGNVLEWKNVTEMRVNQGVLAAISKAQAVIEFTLEGKIVTANENFLSVLGYTLDEIRGQHHGMFVDPAYRASPEYKTFWEKLGRGEYDAGQYKRFGKGGKEIWIQANYSPILDKSGKPFKVVKFASDITAMRTAVDQTQLAVAAAKEKTDPDGREDRRTAVALWRRERPPRHDGECHVRDDVRLARGRERGQGNFDEHHGSLAAHRGTGGKPRGNLGVDGADFVNREKERRKRSDGEPVRGQHAQCRQQGR